jgi:putative transcriptional regulator
LVRLERRNREGNDYPKGVPHEGLSKKILLRVNRGGGNLNNRLRVLRAERKWSQKDLAKAVGVSRQTIIAIETRKRAPSLKLAYTLARAFGKPVQDVFPDEDFLPLLRVGQCLSMLMSDVVQD